MIDISHAKATFSILKCVFRTSETVFISLIIYECSLTKQNGGWIGAAVEASLPEAAASQCYEFEQSVAFLVMTALAAAVVLGYACALIFGGRRLTGMDILSALLVGAGVIRSVDISRPEEFHKFIIMFCRFFFDRSSFKVRPEGLGRVTSPWPG